MTHLVSSSVRVLKIAAVVCNATDRTLSLLSLSLSRLLVLGNIFLATPRWWLPLPPAERAVRVINMADILFNPLGPRL